MDEHNRFATDLLDKAILDLQQTIECNRLDRMLTTSSPIYAKLNKREKSLEIVQKLLDLSHNWLANSKELNLEY